MPARWGVLRRRGVSSAQARSTRIRRYLTRARGGRVPQIRVGGGLSRRYGRSVALQNIRTGGLLGIEKKFLDIPRTGIALTAPTDATGGEIPPTSIVTGCYSAPAQGDGPTNRDGNKIVIVQADWKGAITCAAQVDQTAADVSCNVFVAMVQDQQTNAAQLNSEDVFSNPAASSNLATSLSRNMSYTRRFKILAMKTMTLRIPSLTWDGTNIEQSGFTNYCNLSWRGKMPVTFTTGSTTADIANVTDNSIQMIAFCSNTGLAPTIVGSMRIRFYG